MLIRSKFTAKAAFAIAAFAGLAGCATHVPEYVSSRNTLTYLHHSQFPTIAVKDFEDGGRKPGRMHLCPVKARPGKDAPDIPAGYYTDYIRDAFARELRIGGKYADEDKAAVTITGRIDRIKVSRSLPFRGYWNIYVTLTASNGRSMKQRIKYRFDGDGWVGPAACKNASKAFAPAVQALVQQTIASRDFAALVGQTAATGD